MGLKVLLYLWLLLVVQGALHLNRGLTKRSNGGIHPEKLSATQLAPSSLERSLGKSRLQSVVAISGGKLKMEPKKVNLVSNQSQSAYKCSRGLELGVKSMQFSRK